ncbi:hypothetical protein HBH98_119630 [Parastagonospora nodorum]|nr:hypothetical protein HBH46_232120 [Parastagonospora nodorum]KAH4113770.1 hypothetical protein HBH47_206260 [Parastagonospora nodorum]KAH4285747.1 hypothetical protein HBI01_247920 [Parastagonospora nodorum]KAH4300692.1 hypothetical protein HBI02_148090 [Parastagonospora nodorum]KAH4337324.1 hypothetical protein HBI00_020440 [Parastagonospora nodorum]
MQRRLGAQAFAGRSSSRSRSGYVSLWHKKIAVPGRCLQCPSSFWRLTNPRSYSRVPRMTLGTYPLNGRPDFCNVFQHVAAPDDALVRSHMQRPQARNPMSKAQK